MARALMRQNCCANSDSWLNTAGGGNCSVLGSYPGLPATPERSSQGSRAHGVQGNAGTGNSTGSGHATRSRFTLQARGSNIQQHVAALPPAATQDLVCI
jgi:hypothetical protein